MSAFFLFVTMVFFYGLAAYCLVKKNERAIFYIPVLLFVDKIVDTPSPAVLFYGVMSFIILLLIIQNKSLFRNNIFALILIVYFSLLLTKSNDIEIIRPYIFAVIWLFILIALIPSIYQKYSREVIMEELSNAALIILILFIANSLVSTVYKYTPMEMYGITSGILFGNLWAAAFNPLPMAVFLVFLKGISERRLVYIATALISFFFIMLTLRRTVMGLSALAIVLAILTLLQKKAKMVFVIGAFVALAGYFVYEYTGFFTQFKERVELRKLDERDLAEEKRFIEYTLLYDDMFVYNSYSPWFGYGLFNSAGNYGKGVLDERSLHGDIPNIAHSSGLVGVLLYLLMMATAFLQAIRNARLYQDKLIVFFCIVTFVVYTITGRFTEIASTLLLMLVLMIPMAAEQHESVLVHEEEESDDRTIDYSFSNR